MTLTGWLQISLFFLAVLVAIKPLGLYMASVFSGERTFLSPVLGWFERGLYRISDVDPDKEQSWLGYTLAMLTFSIAGFLTLYAMLRLQAYLPLNPQGFPGVPADLAFNTAVSFVTNTNWQNYGGETTLSHFSQMAGLTVQNFVSAATGMALAVAFTRALARSKVSTLGNFWVDMTRATLYVLMPMAIVVALAFVAMGLPQTLDASVTATTLEGANQVISLGPVASQEAIKQLGTNGGGFFNVNASHPFENPTAWSNYLNIFAMLSISAALVYSFGQMVGNRRQFRDQHQLAELRRRNHHVPPVSDAWANCPELPLGGHRHRPGRGADPRLRPQVGADGGQLLGRHDPSDALPAAAALHRPDDRLRRARRSSDSRRLR